jgi:hypothetical protein
MKFDPAKVLATVEELSDPQFSESARADRLAERFAEHAWQVERRDVETAPTVIARRPFDNPPPLRVLIQTPLGRGMADEPTSRLGGLLKGLRRGEDRGASPAIPTPAELSGLAMLIELARSWPRSWSKRFELVLAATGGQASGFAGARAVALEFDPARSGIPTLVVSLFAPGAGRELIVIGGRNQELASEAARSLWIPTISARSPALDRRLWPASTVEAFPDHVALIGSGLEMAVPPPPDAEALRRAAQLVAEIALRWAKQMADHPGDETDSRSEARSSQKPG